MPVRHRATHQQPARPGRKPCKFVTSCACRIVSGSAPGSKETAHPASRTERQDASWARRRILLLGGSPTAIPSAARWGSPGLGHHVSPSDHCFARVRPIPRRPVTIAIRTVRKSAAVAARRSGRWAALQLGRIRPGGRRAQLQRRYENDLTALWRRGELVIAPDGCARLGHFFSPARGILRVGPGRSQPLSTPR
jgi:hypothetical protein